MSEGLPPKGEQAAHWADRMGQDPMAIVALADHLLRTCGMTLRLGGTVDATPVFEMLTGLGQMPPGSSGAMDQARLLLDGGALTLSGLAAAQRWPLEQLPAVQQELSEAIAKGDGELARSLAAPFLAAIVSHERLPDLPPAPDGTIAAWIDAARRIHRARWGEG